MYKNGKKNILFFKNIVHNYHKSKMQSQIQNPIFSNSVSNDFSRIFISRHCKTQWNLDGMLQGTTDLPLCNIGRREAQLIAPNLKKYNFDLVITSPLKRAFETAIIYSNFLNIPIVIEKGFRELDHGKWQGKLIKDMLSDDNCRYRDWLENPIFVPIPSSSETVVEAQKRIVIALYAMKAQYKNKRILIITHKHIRAILRCTLQEISLSEFKNQINESIEPMQVF